MQTAHKNESPAVTEQFVEKNSNNSIVSPNDEKDFATMRALFALKGHTLQKQHRADDGRVSYLVSRWGQTRTLSHWGDLQAFLTQVGGANAYLG